ncbi:hypothetical protein [Xanthomonas perforans]|nr:hypothetical protein [Xanthomonas perforans]
MLTHHKHVALAEFAAALHFKNGVALRWQYTAGCAIDLLGCVAKA